MTASLMLVLFLFLILDHSLLSAKLTSFEQFATCDVNDLKEKSIIRGSYKDVAQESNGAIIISARSNIFVGGQFNSSPLRSSIYKVSNVEGHCYAPLGSSIIVQFIQAYQINRVKFWLYDYTIKTYNFQVFAEGKDDATETLLYETTAAGGLQVVNFADQPVSKLRFYNRGGSSVDTVLTLIKIQAYYAF